MDVPTPTPEEPLSREGLDRRRHLEIMRTVTVPSHREYDWRPAIAVLVAVVLLAIIGFGAYWQFFHAKAASPKAKAPAQTATHSTAPSPSLPSISTQPYTSSDFNLSFNYPDGWAVVDSGNGPMTVTSPGMQLTTASGQSVPGQITMTIQKQGQLPASFSAGTALAVLKSQSITYAQPTASQTSKAYLSFVQYAATTTRGGLDSIYLTGNYGYAKDQTIPASDIAGVDPLVTVSFTKCATTACTSNLTPLTIASTSWNSGAFQAPILAMLTSFAFQ
jgi:hypothetical protein